MLQVHFCRLACFIFISFLNPIGNYTEILESLNSSFGLLLGYINSFSNILRKQRGSLKSWNYSLGGGFHHLLSPSEFGIYYDTQLQVTVFRISYNWPHHF